MKTMRYLLFLLLPAMPLQAQFSVLSPQIGAGAYAITDTVYMSPSGNDNNPGTADLPVLSFSKALQKIPFGTPGVNGGNRYGLIRLLPGQYITATGFQQGEAQWQQGNTYKNVSVEGIGDVFIGGAPGQPASNHALRLVGNHIFVRNLKLGQCQGIGLLINRAADTPEQAGPEHVLIEGVTIDSTDSHGLLVVNADFVEVRNTKVLHASRLRFSELDASACNAWPSGLKLQFCKNVWVHDCEVAYTRGEGLNFHNCQTSLADANRLHDNFLNLYDDNSARLIVRNNYLFQTPGAGEYAYPCPQQLGQPRLAGNGMMMANEGACLGGSYGPTFQYCTRVDCSILGFNTYSFPTVDSVFVYNNIFHNCGKSILFWEGNVNILNPNCIRNVVVAHNTVIGVAGDPGVSGAQVDHFFPDYNLILNSYGQLINVRFYGNIFSFDAAQYPAEQPVRQVFNNIGSFDVGYNYDIWSEAHAFLGAQDVVREGLPATMEIDSFQLITPGTGDSLLEFDVAAYAAWLNTDFFGMPRRQPLTNAGAIERAVSGVWSAGLQEPLRLYPNPGRQMLMVECPGGSSVLLRDVYGRLLLERAVGEEGQVELPVADLPSGMYTVECIREGKRRVEKWIRQ